MMDVTNLKSLFADDEGVSPVIGVILMVAVTVILAAVIGAFVMNMGDNLSQSAPSANFEFEASDTDGDNSYVVQVTHDGGDSITNKNTKSLVVKDMADNAQEIWADDAGNGIETWSANGDVAAGDNVYIGDDSGETNNGEHDGDTSTSQVTGFSQGDTLKVIWTADNGQSSQTIGQYTV